MSDRQIVSYSEYDPIHNYFIGIVNYDIEELQKRYESGNRFYVFYRDGSREEVLPEEVKDLRIAKTGSFRFAPPKYVNIRIEAIFEILNEIMEPLLEILPDEEPKEEEIVLKPMNVNLKSTSIQSVQSVQAASTEESDISETANESYKDKIRRAFNDLKTLVEEGESFVENDEQ